MSQKLRVWYNPQVPGTPYTKEVKNLDEAMLVIDTLVTFSAFEFENNIKPDYCDAADLEMWDEQDQEWQTWYDDDGNDFSDWRNEHENRS